MTSGSSQLEKPVFSINTAHFNNGSIAAGHASGRIDVTVGAGGRPTLRDMANQEVEIPMGSGVLDDLLAAAAIGMTTYLTRMAAGSRPSLPRTSSSRSCGSPLVATARTNRWPMGRGGGWPSCAGTRACGRWRTRASCAARNFRTSTSSSPRRCPRGPGDVSDPRHGRGVLDSR